MTNSVKRRLLLRAATRSNLSSLVVSWRFQCIPFTYIRVPKMVSLHNNQPVYHYITFISLSLFWRARPWSLWWMKPSTIMVVTTMMIRHRHMIFYFSKSFLEWHTMVVVMMIHHRRMPCMSMCVSLCCIDAWECFKQQVRRCYVAALMHEHHALNSKW